MKVIHNAYIALLTQDAGSIFKALRPSSSTTTPDAPALFTLLYMKKITITRCKKQCTFLFKTILKPKRVFAVPRYQVFRIWFARNWPKLVCFEGLEHQTDGKVHLINKLS